MICYLFSFITGKYFNFLTLKEKIHKEIKHFEDVTFCYRFNFLSFIAYNKRSAIFLARTPNYVEFVNPISGTKRNLTDGLSSAISPIYQLSAVLATFPHAMYEVIQAGGMYILNTVYEENINANQWHIVCFGFDAKKRQLYMVHNGATAVNVTQPEIWAEVNRGFDTTIVSPFTTNYPLGSGDLLYYKALESAQWSGIIFGHNMDPCSGSSVTL